jgi:glutathione peroxidase
MIKLSLFALLFCATSTVSIYSFKVNNLSGQETDFDAFRGKKILLVNIASNSVDTQQLYQLQQLHEQYSDSLVVVAFPSNSFGNETHSNEELAGLLQNTYHINFPVIEISNVTGEEANSVYKWIASKDDIGVLNGKIKTDYWKFLVSSSGQIIGIFTEAVPPMDSKITNAVMASL